MKLVLAVYRLVDGFPRKEQFALCDQLRRAVVSVPSNVAEGFGRDTHKEFAHFLSMSQGSLYEVETQLEIASLLGYVALDDEILRLMNSVSNMLGALMRRLNGSPRKAPDTNHQAPTTN